MYPSPITKIVLFENEKTRLELDWKVFVLADKAGKLFLFQLETGHLFGLPAVVSMILHECRKVKRFVQKSHIFL